VNRDDRARLESRLHLDARLAAVTDAHGVEARRAAVDAEHSPPVAAPEHRALWHLNHRVRTPQHEPHLDPIPVAQRSPALARFREADDDVDPLFVDAQR